MPRLPVPSRVPSPSPRVAPAARPVTLASSRPPARAIGGATVLGLLVATLLLALLATLAGRVLPARAATTGATAPVLVIVSGTANAGAFLPEVLRAEGLNLFTVVDIASVDASTLAGHDVVLLAKMPLSAARVADFTGWVNGGGRLVAFAPDAQLLPLLGLSAQAGTLSEPWLRVDDATRPGNGLARAPLQVHGAAQLVRADAARAVATFWRDPDTPTGWPALTIRETGLGSGRAAAFLFDLPTSLVQTRQGNPAWAATERDGQAPITSDDKYYGAAAGDVQPDWIARAARGVPQADEAQRLLGNLVGYLAEGRRPLPRLWTLPRDLPAAVVMTGDDHANGGTSGRFDHYLAASPPGCVVALWQCIRSTSYIFVDTPLRDADAAAYDAQGFEIALHLDSGCADYDAASLEGFYADQLGRMAQRFPSLPPSITERHHCTVWSDWASGATVQRTHGIRLDTTSYAWPAAWVDDVPGYLSGSAQPMPWMGLDGRSSDVYQAATQVTDESAQSEPFTIDWLLDRAVGPDGFTGVIVVNAHTDAPDNAVSDAVLASAAARGVPVVSARQMLTWLDGRNASSFDGVAWDGTRLTFTLTVGTGATGLRAMVPVATGGLRLASITRAGTATPWTVRAVKGVDWASFDAGSGGAVVATYAADTTAPTLVSRWPTVNATGVDPGTAVTVAFGEAMDPASITTATVRLLDASGAAVPSTVRYDAVSHAAVLQPLGPLAVDATWTVSVSGAGSSPAVRDLAGNATAARTWRFTTGRGAIGACPCRVFAAGATPGTASASDADAVEVGVRFTSDVAGWITGLRFYKGPANTGTHVGNLWSDTGAHLASVTFTNETATGWQQADFARPVAIAAGTVYRASYLAPHGGYAMDAGAFATGGIDAPPLHLLRDGQGGHDGVYAYGTSSRFPTESYQASNYWVDVVYAATPPPPGDPAPTVTATSPAAGARGQNVGVEVRATVDEALDPASVTTASVELRDSRGALVPATVGWSPESLRITLWPQAPLAPSTTYTARLHGGAAAPHVVSLGGTPLAADVSWSFTTGALSAACAAPANAVVRENCLAGVPAAEWDVAGIGDPTIQGFASTMSAAPGETVTFRVDSPARDWRIDVYRLGWYDGAGARQVARVMPAVALPQSQPPCLSDAATGLVDCGDWAASASWTVPAGAASGVYVARLVRGDTGGASHMPIVVRDDASRSAIVVQTADANWQAHNDYGGRSLYAGGPGTNPARAYKVSYDRPWWTRGVDGGREWLFHAEVPLWRFLEHNGYDVAYVSAVDVDRAGAALANHRVFVSGGHDATWSAAQRAAVTAAREAGMHLLFAGGATGFWKHRWEPSIDASATPWRTLVSYRETLAGAKIDPSPTWTGTWRDARFSPPADGGRPEDALAGPMFRVTGPGGTALQVTAEDGRMRLWRGTALATQSAGHVATLADGTLGFEWDALADDASRPAGVVPLGTTTVAGASVLQDEGATYATGTAVHRPTLYRTPGGALVFAAGTVQWSWGLDAAHDGTAVVPDVRMQQAMVNLLADMGVQPATRQKTLVAASASTDAAAPTSVITSPVAGATVSSGAGVTIRGTATDAGGGQVGAVEVSVDGGTSWHLATGRASWTYAWTPTATGPATLRSRAVDDSANRESPGAGVTVTVGAADTVPPTVTGRSPAPGATGVPRTTVVTATFSEAMDPATITSQTVQLTDPAGVRVAATVTYDAATTTARLVPAGTLSASSTYKATVKGGTTAARVTDVAGNPMAKTVSWSFTTGP